MRKTGGILTIIGGGLFGIRIGIGMIEAFVTGADIFWMYKDVALVIAFAIVALIVGILALVGGIYALRARVWGLALAGGIVLIVNGAVAGTFATMGVFGEDIGLAFSFIPFLIFGISGTIFIALRKGEFE